MIDVLTLKQELFQLHAQIDARVQSIREQYPQWLCAKGCGSCCRRLAEVPELALAEWNLLQEGLQALPLARLDEIRKKLADLAAATARPVVCPLLDEVANICPVYAQRPLACRTYGFYVQREHGLYCKDIEAQEENGELPSVVWGNQDVIAQKQHRLGESRPLTQWFALWMESREP